MLRKFLKNLGFLILLNLLVKPLYILGIDAEVQNRVGQESYGLYFALINLSYLFNILIDIGINSYNNRNIAQNEKLIGKHFSKLFSIKAILALLYAVVTMILGLVLGYKSGAYYLLAFLTLNQVIVSFILFLRSNLTALHLFKYDSIVSVLDRSLLVVICGILLFTNITDGRFEITWFVYLQTGAYFCTLLAALLFIGKRIGKLRWDLQKSFTLHVIKKSVPYALFMLIIGLYNRVDGIMLDNLLVDGSLQAGYYAQGYRFFEAASMFAFLFAVPLLPMFARLIKDKEQPAALAETGARLLVGGGVFAAIFFFYWSPYLLNWRYIEVSTNAEMSFSALMIGFVGVCMFYIYGTLLTANASLKVLNVISFCGLIINLIFNFYLIPRYGAFGAAIATMVTQIFAGLVQAIYAHRVFSISFNSRLFLSFLIFSLLFITANILILESGLSGGSGFLLCALAGTILLFATGTIRIKELVGILRLKEY